MKFKKSIFVILCVVTSMMMVGIFGFAAGGEAGSKEDPLIPESIFNTKTAELEMKISEIKSLSDGTKVDALNAQIEAIKKDVEKTNTASLQAKVDSLQDSVTKLKQQDSKILESLNRIEKKLGMTQSKPVDNGKQTNGSTGTIIGTSVNIRTAADLTSAKVGTINKGETVQIINAKGEWLYVNYKGVLGWVMASYVKR